MSYTKLLFILEVADEAFDKGELKKFQYERLVSDLERKVIKLDRIKTSKDFSDFVAEYQQFQPK
jgi:hypothetical protein